MYEHSSSEDDGESARKASMSIIPVKLREAIQKGERGSKIIGG